MIKYINLLSKVHKKYFIFLIIASFISACLESLSIIMLFPLVQSIFNHNISFEIFNISFIKNFFAIKDISLLFLLIFVSLFLCKNIFFLLFSHFQSSFFSNVEANISTRVFEKNLMSSINTFSNKNSYEVIRDSSLASVFSSTFLMSLMSLITEFLSFILIIAGISFIVFSETLIVLFFLLLLTLIHYFFIRNKIYKLAENIHSSVKIKNQYIIQSLDLFKEVKIFNLYNKFFSNYSKFSYKITNNQKILGVLRVVNRPILEIFSILLIGLYLFFLINNESDLTLYFAKISIFVAAAFRLLPSVNRINTSIQRLRTSLPAIKNLYENINNYYSYREKKFRRINFNKNIILKNIYYKYDNENYLFKNLKFNIQKGKKILILGRSGCGKSTLIELIMGLIRPEHGSILVDGKNIHGNLQGWFDKISYVPQKPHLIDDTIENNINFFVNKNNTIDYHVKINRIISLVKIKELLSKYNKKIFIGERGKRLSGGQAQRIAIARALLKQFEILVIDEGTSSLDIKNENDIIKNIIQLDGKLTIIFVSHKKSLSKYFDLVYELKDNKLIRIYK